MDRKHRPSFVSRLPAALMRTAMAHRIASWIICRYARFVVATSRWTYLGVEENLAAFLKPARKGHVLLWHNRILLMPFGWKFKDFPLTVLISDHRDGRLMARVLDAAGVNHIRIPATALEGRSKLGAAMLRIDTVRTIRQASGSGQTVSVIGDGPTGPRFVLKPFAIDLARMCDAEIVLVTCSVRRRVILNSWDRLVVPLPFNQGIFRASTFSYDPRGLDAGAREELRRKVERDLRAFVDETDAMMGHAPVDPMARLKEYDRLSADEYYAHKGGTDRDFVRGLYQDLLHRDPADREVEAWLPELERRGRAQIVDAFLSSDEVARLRGRQAPPATNGAAELG